MNCELQFCHLPFCCLGAKVMPRNSDIFLTVIEEYTIILLVWVHLLFGATM